MFPVPQVKNSVRVADFKVLFFSRRCPFYDSFIKKMTSVGSLLVSLLPYIWSLSWSHYGPEYGFLLCNLSSFITTRVMDVYQITWSSILCIKRTASPVLEGDKNWHLFLLFDFFIYVPTWIPFSLLKMYGSYTIVSVILPWWPSWIEYLRNVYFCLFNVDFVADFKSQ